MRVWGAWTRVTWWLGFIFLNQIELPVPVTARSKAWVYGRSPVEIAGSNPTGGMDVCCECCVLSGRGLCDGLITRPEESYRLCCVVVCDLEKPREWGDPGPGGGLSRQEQTNKRNEMKLREISVSKAKRVYLPCWRFTVHIKGFGHTELGTRKTGKRIRWLHGRVGACNSRWTWRRDVPMYVHAEMQDPFCHAFIQHVWRLVTFRRTAFINFCVIHISVIGAFYWSKCIMRGNIHNQPRCKGIYVHLVGESFAFRRTHSCVGSPIQSSPCLLLLSLFVFSYI